METVAELRVALIGTGVMGADHARRIAERIPGARLTAVCDVDRERAEHVAREFPGCRASADAIGEIRSADIDAVVIASPGFTHEALVLEAVRASKPVLCEKPLTPDPESSLRIVEAEVAAGQRLVQVGFMRRYDPGFGRIHTEAADPASTLGGLKLLRCTHRAADVPGNPPAEFLIEDCLVHEFDQLRWLTGRELASVQVLGRPETAGTRGESSDPIIAAIELEGGIAATVEVNVFSGIGYEVRCEAVFDRGAITAGAAAQHTSTVIGRDGRSGFEVADDFRERFRDAYDAEFLDWVEAARSGTAAGASAWDGYAAAVAIEAGLASQLSREPEACDPGSRPRLYEAVR